MTAAPTVHSPQCPQRPTCRIGCQGERAGPPCRWGSVHRAFCFAVWSEGCSGGFYTWSSPRHSKWSGSGLPVLCSDLILFGTVLHVVSFRFVSFRSSCLPDRHCRPVCTTVGASSGILHCPGLSCPVTPGTIKTRQDNAERSTGVITSAWGEFRSDRESPAQLLDEPSSTPSYCPVAQRIDRPSRLQTHVDG